MTTALFLLRCIQTGLSLSELEQLDYGMVLDVFTESLNDEFEYPMKASKADIARL